MNIYNALDLKKGKKTEYNKMGSLMQPVQFLPSSEKDDEWRAWNLDWLEWQGVRQLRRNAVRLLKNYKLAKGIIDKRDYIVDEDNPNGELIDILTKEDKTATNKIRIIREIPKEEYYELFGVINNELTHNRILQYDEVINLLK
jgi:hypothetical protein